MHLDFFPMISICSWHIMLPFNACHWLLIGPKCEAYGFGYITERYHKTTAAKYSYGKGHSGSTHENYIASSWSMSSGSALDWIGHSIFGIPVNFTTVSMQHSLNKDVKHCKEKWNWAHKYIARRHCWEQLLLYFKVPLMLIEGQ